MQRARTTLQQLTLSGPSGALEALLEEPAEGTTRAGLVVVCHPHPLHGGTMQNKVAHTLARSLCGLGLSALRFNFRGVGASAGSYGSGLGELEDALAVLDWAAQARPRSDAVARGLFLRRVHRPAGVAATTRTAGRQRRAGSPNGAIDGPPRCPWLVVQGLEDELVDSCAVRAWTSKRHGAVELVELAGVDHFFHGRLNELRTVLENALGAAAQALPEGESGIA
jgi:alpha/beta superfamily hydrolase